jgi:hypothetical protein
MPTVDAWRLPWLRATVPHGVLDVLRGCNITCDACYNALPPRLKTLPEVEADLDELQRRRPLSSVTIAGGEITLHPGLVDIVRLVKRRGLGAELCTNGVALTPALLAELKAAGADIVLLHIDGGQHRPDLPARPGAAELRALWREKTRLVAAHGIDVGLVLTAREDNLAEVSEVVRFTLESPEATYLLVTLYRDLADVATVRGGIDGGMRAERIPGGRRSAPDNLTNRRILRHLDEAHGLQPFGYLGSNRDPDDPRWLSYLVATAADRAGGFASHAVRPSRFEPALLRVLLRATGRYPMYLRQNAPVLALQLVLNGLAGGALRRNLAFLARAARPGVALRAKRLLFQCLAEVAGDGEVIHCEPCPDAVVKGGRLVPVCITDKVDAPPGSRRCGTTTPGSF